MDNHIEYKPGLHKLIHHLDHLQKIQNKQIVGPIHLSVFPTNFCQLKCSYCCFGKTERTNSELSFEDYKIAIDTLVKYGLKATEFSGGGCPLLWSHFSEAIEYAKNKNLKLSLVTNGLALKNIRKEILEKFDWIRVSIQSEEYARKILFNKIPDNVKKSMSFIVYDNWSLNEIKNIYNFAKEKNIIIRVAPNRPCEKEWEEIVENEVKKYGYPLLFFEKEYGNSNGCYMIYIRAGLDWNGNFLPCPSIELSPEHVGKIPEDFGVCKAKDIEKWLINNTPHDLGYKCSFCNCGKNSNDFIGLLLKEVEDKDFV